jgi:hypothetical protein
MTRNISQLFRVLLFFAGAGIILLAFFLMNEDKELTREDKFVWISAGIMYIVFFIPFFFSMLNVQNFSRKTPALSMVWLGNILYITASVFVIILLTRGILGFNFVLIIQSTLGFFYLVNIFFAYFAVAHVGNVAHQEAQKQQYLTQIKSKANVLLLSANRLPGEYQNAQKMLVKSLDDIKYIYPVDGGAGTELEMNIIQSLGLISEITGNILSGAQNPGLDNEAIKLQSFVNERKLLRN